SLELFVCDYDADIDAGQTSAVWIRQTENARDHLVGILEKKLEDLAAPLRKQGLKVSVDVAWDHPLDEAIVRKVIKAEPWLVAKDTHHHNVLKRTILSNTDWSLIRECPAPLYLAKPQGVAKAPKIAAAVDPLHEHDKPAQLDHKLVKIAQKLAEATGGELHIAHTYPLPQPMSVPEGAPIVDISEEVEAEHRRAFDAFLKKCKLPGAKSHLLEGQPHQRLPELVAGINIDVMVMGAVSRRGLDRIFLGSTAERVLDRLPCDLLIVKPDGFESSVR
ncbi:MAG TPA: universal stress protein, partial [Gammaproteobacteria bacterium]|nr:universal stress protein [Gammaproteobacteria bacterium]